MLDARRLATLRAVARCGSFAAAALELGFTQAAVSQHIADLERTAGMPLLLRRPVRLTEAGRIALRAAEAQADALEAAEERLAALRDGRAGTLVLATFASAARALVPAALATLLPARPGLDVTVLQLEPGPAEEALLAGRADVAITFEYDVLPTAPPTGVERRPLRDDPVHVALPAGHRLAAERWPLELRSLADERWIAAPLAGIEPARVGVRSGSASSHSVRYLGEDFAAVLAHVAAGLGVALLPALALHDPPAGVAVRPLAAPQITRRLSVATRTGVAPHPAQADLEAALRR